jgi:hypothetical protein
MCYALPPPQGGFFVLQIIGYFSKVAESLRVIQRISLSSLLEFFPLCHPE